MELSGKVVLVTGASSGIGEATARLASARGARVVLTARRDDVLQDLARQLPDALAVAGDACQPGALDAVVAAAVERFGTVDVLVNNAGQGLHLPLEQVDLDDFAAIMELNVYAPLRAMQAVLPVMRAAGGGAIVNISSGTSRMVLPGVGAYAASKAALNQLSQTARAEFAADGIAVSLVYPFLTSTPFHDNLRAGGLGRPRPGMTPHTPQHVAEAIVAVIVSGDPEVVLSPQ